MNIFTISSKSGRTSIITLLLVIVCAQASAQFRVIDKADGQPIAGAYIFDTDNQLLCMSDVDGNVKALSGMVTISTLSYEPLTIDASTVHGDVALEQKAFSLPEVVVKKADYVKLRGVFRDIYTNDGKTILYREGISDYYINMKNGKIKRRVWACREYEHKKIRNLFNFETFMLSGRSTNLSKIHYIKADSVSNTKGDTLYLATKVGKHASNDAAMLIVNKKKGIYRRVIDNTKFKDVNTKSLNITVNINDWSFSQPEGNMSSLVSLRTILNYTWKWDKKSTPIKCKELRDFVTTEVTTMDKATAEKEMKDKSETADFDLPNCLPSINYNVSQQTKGLEKRKFWDPF